MEIKDWVLVIGGILLFVFSKVSRIKESREE